MLDAFPSNRLSLLCVMALVASSASKVLLSLYPRLE
jgi:hypothetical protein